MNKMKKMMFAVIASLFAAVTYAAGVASANIVGYAQTSLLKNTYSKFIAPQFGNIGNTKQDIDIQSIRPTDINGASDGVFLSFLDSLGGTKVTYSWVNWATDPNSGEAVAGWADDNFELAKGVTMSPGDAVWVQCNFENQAIQSAGQVPNMDVKVQLSRNTGSISLGNSTPIAIDIQDIMPESIEECSGYVFLSFLDGLGGTRATYSWVDWATDPISGKTVTGWADNNFEFVRGVAINPGEGVWVQCNRDDDQYIIVPGVDL